jgi:hypothetical protein
MIVLSVLSEGLAEGDPDAAVVHVFNRSGDRGSVGE